ncbi:hypothetical protein SDC9_43875 [bioreactor metagenome]|uniref:Uncharacterized protein n=1 Tax=bioreactor metagenome TaxID=1076179 RepID=A0A644W5J8_9ZZZZ
MCKKTMKTRKPISFHAPRRMYANGTSFPKGIDLILNQIKFVFQRLRSILVALILIATSSFFGVFSYRVFHLDDFTLRNIFDCIFSQNPPESKLIIGVLATALVYGVFFFTNNVDKLPDSNVLPFTKFLAVVSILLSFDFIFLNFSFLSIFPWNLNLHANVEYFCTQTSTLVFIMFLWILYPKLAPISTPPTLSLNLPQPLKNFFAMFWMLIISISIILVSVFLSTSFFHNSDNQMTLFGINWLILPKIGAFLTGCFVASITYWLPKFRNVKRRFGIIRLIIAVGSLFGVGFIYRGLADPDRYLAGVAGVFILTILFIPLQRTLS